MLVKPTHQSLHDVRMLEDAIVISPVIGVLGANGGAGATTVAINLAAGMSQLFGMTTLVDANLQHPDVAASFGREPRFTILDLLVQMPEIDQEVFEACCIDVGINLRLLSPPLTGGAALKTSLSQLAQCLDSIRGLSASWIVDLPRHLDRHLVTVLDACNVTILVFEASLMGVAAARRWLNIFDDLDYPKEKTICLLNRSRSAPSAIESQLAHFFGGLQLCKIPNAYRLLQGCLATGQTAVLKHPSNGYSREIIKLAQYLRQYLGSGSVISRVSQNNVAHTGAINAGILP